MRRFHVHSAQVAWGELRTDGSLGYDGSCCPAPRSRADLAGAALISAHAPSRVEIELDAPASVSGVLNASAQFDPRNPVEFWADWNFIGEATVPGSVTDGFTLSAGRHVLVTTASEPHSRHAIWALREATEEAPALEVFTIAAYPEARVPTELCVLARSARKARVPLRVVGVGERYVSHAEMKIRRLRPLIANSHAGQIAYVDGRDSVFLGSRERLARDFSELGAAIVVSTEAQCWPIHDAAWVASFPRDASGCNWLNAGQWMGERRALVDALDALAELSARARRSQLQGPLAICSRAPEDDQLLWQAAWLGGLVELQPDYAGALFRNVNTLDTSLVDNRDFDLTRGATFRASGRSASVLHFSGSAAGHCMAQWAGLLGAL
jgi:hypothetical protein